MKTPILTQYDTDAEDYVEVLPKDEKEAMQKVLDNKNPVPPKRDKHKEQASLHLRYDNPGGRWLKENLDNPNVHSYNSAGSPKSFGEITAWYEEDVLIPVSTLSKLKGASGEHNFVRERDFNKIKTYMTKNNRLPPISPNNNAQYVPFIQVNYVGDVWVNEGNHRIKVAKALGWKYLPVSIKYHLGGEDMDEGPLSPRKVEVFHAKALSEGYTVKNFKGVL